MPGLVPYYIQNLINRGTRRQFSENTCSENDSRSKLKKNFRNIYCKMSCLPASPRIFEDLKNSIIAHF